MSIRERRWVSRENILNALKRRSDVRMTIFAAAAGFGKSTTMAQWEAELRRLGCLTIWVSFVESDNHEAAFLSHVVSAVTQSLDEPDSVNLAYRSSPLPQLDVVLSALLSTLAASSRQVVLFLDDYHVVEAAPVKGFVERLTRQAPDNVRFVIGSRTTPDLNLARLRVLGDLVEVGPDNLRFAFDEAEAFFNRKLGLAVSASTVEALRSRSEGWVAGLQLASLSIGPNRGADDIMLTFTGANRNVADFLMGEVFIRLSADLSSFLLQSCLLERFSAEACKAIFRIHDAEALIARIETANLFLVPLDEERRWFRYHHLFRDFLIRELERRKPESIVPFHLAAADWFGERGMLDEAIRHALAAGDQARAATFVETNGLDLIAQCQLLYVRQLLALLPKRLVDQRIRLQLIILWLAVHSSQPEIATETLGSARALMAAGPTDRRDPGTLAGTSIEVEIEVLEAAVLSTLEQFEAARDKALTVLRQIAPDAWFMEGATANVVGYNLYALGDLDGARTAIAAARRAHERSGSLLGITVAACYLAIVERAAARFQVAERILREAIAEARARIGPNSYAEALAGALLAELAYETNASGEALTLVENLGPLIEGAAIIVYPLASVPTYARVLQLTGRSEAALEMLDRLYRRVRGSVYRRLASVLLHDRVRLLLDLDRRSEARILLSEHRSGQVEQGITAANEFEFFAEARVLMAEKSFRQSAAILDDLLERTRASGRVRRQILALILRSKLAGLRPDQQEADRYLLEALRLGQSPGFVRSFVDEGRVIIDGLTRLRAAQAATDPSLSGYAERILHASRASPEGLRTANEPHGEKDHLTRRETELLRCLAQGMSNREIAVALSVSETTVKWHLKNIFGKLAVTNRVQAVRAAQGAAGQAAYSKGGA